MKAERLEVLKAVLAKGVWIVDIERGEIFSNRTGKKLGHYGHGSEYLFVSTTLNRKTAKFPIHQVIAIVAGFDLSKKQVNHIDGNRFNNRVENLEVVTPSENCLHAHSNGLVGNRLTKEQVYEIKVLLSKGGSTTIIAGLFNTTARNIRHIKDGTTHKDVKI